MDSASKRNWQTVQAVLMGQDDKIREQEQKLARLQQQVAQMTQQIQQIRMMSTLGRGSGPTG